MVGGKCDKGFKWLYNNNCSVMRNGTAGLMFHCLLKSCSFAVYLFCAPGVLGVKTHSVTTGLLDGRTLNNEV